MKIAWPNLIKLDLTYGPKMSTIVCIFDFFQCSDNDTSVATFVATLVITLDTTEIEEGSENNGYEGLKMIRESS